MYVFSPTQPAASVSSATSIWVPSSFLASSVRGQWTFSTVTFTPGSSDGFTWAMTSRLETRNWGRDRTIGWLVAQAR
jgi:hypothetical protein